MTEVAEEVVWDVDEYFEEYVDEDKSGGEQVADW